MPRVSGLRERRHQPFWDTLIRTRGVPSPKLQPSTRLFGNANVGNLSLTNLQVAGQLASDQTYVAMALRNWMFFDGPNKRKPQFVAPAWYFPSGGGIYGGGLGDDAVYNNGYPSQGGIMKLARPIIVPVRQNFNVNAEFFSVGSESALDLLNGGDETDQKVITFMIDGLQTRDVQ